VELALSHPHKAHHYTASHPLAKEQPASITDAAAAVSAATELLILPSAMQPLDHQHHP
jgi:hypothetical protein